MAKVRFSWVAALSAGLSACAPGARPDEPVKSRSAEITTAPEAKLLASDGSGGAGFGDSVSLFGNTALIGAPSDANFGAAYVFLRTGTAWAQQAKIVAFDAAPYDLFGSAVAISGDTALIGSPNDDFGLSEAGAAYIYVRSGTTWALQTKLTPGTIQTSFGVAGALSGDTALIGSTNGVHVYVRAGTTWSKQATLTPSDATGQFGFSVALDGDTALVGAAGDSTNGLSAGAAYVFLRSGTSWSQTAKLLATGGAAQDGLGAHVSLSGDTALLGAPGDDEKGSNAGAAYVFVRSGSTWTQSGKLLGSDAIAVDAFGSSVAIANDVALIGASGSDAKATNSGAAYLFVRSGGTWVQQDKAVPLDGQAGDLFGNAAAVSGETLLVAAYGDDDKGSFAGSAYVLVLSGKACTLLSECPSGFCVAGMCCDSACTGACQTCKKAGGAPYDGVCTTVAVGGAGTPACAPYLCNGTNISCPTSCAQDSQCSTGQCADGVCCDADCGASCEACVQAKTGKPDGTCAPVVSGTDPDNECKDSGSPGCGLNGRCDGAGACQSYSTTPGCAPLPCSGDAECASGYCVDGICCDTACGGPCRSCLAAKKGKGVDGVCESVAADTDPDSECVQDPNYPASCKADGECDGAGACRQLAKLGTACGTTSCVGNVVKGQVCNGLGACAPDANGVACAPFLCQGNACSSTCSADSECDASAFCTTTGVCATKQANGATCDRSEECQSVLCVDGYCCNAICTAQCQACDVKGLEGSCAAVVGPPHGVRPECQLGTAADPCKEAQCDGKVPDECAGFVGSLIKCREPSCAGGEETLEAHCDGAGNCAEAIKNACAPFTCGPTSCKETCAVDAECASGSKCDTQSGTCISGATCDGDHTVTDPTGKTIDCTPYHCAPNGSCLQSCASKAECASGHACNADHACVVPTKSDDDDGGGCGCRTAGSDSQHTPGFIGFLWLLSLAGLRRARQ